nr:transposase [Thermoanaerobacterium xylanolyticum]
MCWPEKAFKNQNALHAFICTDTELDTETILNYYSQRWPIEIFFRQTKNNLGLNTYQVRSTKSIDRLL